MEARFKFIGVFGLCLGILAPGFCFEMVYKKVDPDGHVTLSDNPLPTSDATVEKIVVPSATQQSFSSSPALSPAPQAAAKTVHYSIAIQSPRPQETLSWTADEVTIVVNVAPKLAQGTKLQLYHNGEPQGIAQIQTKFKLAALPRGAHTFSVAVVDATETNVLALSEPVTVFQHRTSVLTSPLHSSHDSAE